MNELEKTIRGFECCHQMVHDRGDSACGKCPYKNVQSQEQIDLGGIECIAVLHDDALEFLKDMEEQRDINVSIIERVIYKIKMEINPYGRPFEGSLFDFGVFLIDWLKRIEESETK